MKVLIPILIGLLVVGCGKKEPSISRDEIVELETRKALRHRFDSNPESKGAIINSLVLQKEGENKYVGSVEITDPDGSKMKLDLEVTDHGGKIFFETKLPQKTSPNKLIDDPIVEKAIRVALYHKNGELTKADLEKVTELDLGHNQLTEVPKELEKLAKLETLDLRNNELTEVKGLEKLKQLTLLSLRWNKLTEVKGLENLTKLEYLSLFGNELTDVKGLEKLTQLGVLDLAGNKLTDVRSLEKLTQLTNLQLYNNQLTDLKGLNKLTQLTNLDLYGNQLTDVEGLEKLTQLESLNLKNNPDLTKAQIDELQKALPKCKIQSNAK